MTGIANISYTLIFLFGFLSIAANLIALYRIDKQKQTFPYIAAILAAIVIMSGFYGFSSLQYVGTFDDNSIIFLRIGIVMSLAVDILHAAEVSMHFKPVTSLKNQIKQFTHDK